MIFVFGSNLAGIHGAGAALYAYKNHGAIWHLGAGIQGESYAIPTKDSNIQTLPLKIIKRYVDQFIILAEIMAGIERLATKVGVEGPPIEFKVTRIGCGLAGYTDEQIAPLFELAPGNCLFDETWKPWLGSCRMYWGHQ